MIKLAKSLLLASVLTTMPALAADDARVTRLLEYVQTLDERITKLEAQLKGSGSSSVVSDAKLAVGGWTDPAQWRKLKHCSTLKREVLARLGEPTITEGNKLIYEGTINGKYLIGYVEIINNKACGFEAPDF